jgi:predicted outer membrane repeat protein
VLDCQDYEDGTRCGYPLGVCFAGECRWPSCRTAEDCEDRIDCTVDACTPAGDTGFCENTKLSDGTPCAGGTCSAGACKLTDTLVPCTEQGIRNAVAAGGNEPYTFECDGATTVATSATIIIGNDVILDGEGDLTIDAGRGHSVLRVDPDYPGRSRVTAELRGVALVGGEGGGISVRGSITLTNSTVTGNSTDLYGGGILLAQGGTLTLLNSTVAGNHAKLSGGGIATAGRLVLTNSTISGNSADEDGGGIAGGGPMTVNGSTFSGNVAADQGGAIFAWGGLVGSSFGGSAPARLTLTGTVVDGDCAADAEAEVISNGYNIESAGDTCGFDHETDQVNVAEEQLNLQPLADNGGPTETQVLGVDSIAIDSIPAEDCVDFDGEPLTTDQRGEPRPETGGTMCDIGAFEVQQ